MTDPTDHTVPPGLADLPLNVRQARDVETFQEQQAAITRRYEVICASERAHAAVLLARFLSIAPLAAAKLRGE